MKINPKPLCVSPECQIIKVMERLNQSRMGISLVIDDERHLLGVVMDGDIRRALLKGLGLETPIREAMKHDPIVSPDGLSPTAMTTLMRANAVRHLPIVDEDGCLIALEYLDLIAIDGQKETMIAVIMAGGKGQRLRPLTNKLPKPMLPVGNRPILEIIVESLQKAHCERIFISVGYLGQSIQDHFGDGTAFGLEIHYLVEPEPLGTAGSLSLIPDGVKPTSPFLVINGDLLTRLNLKAFLDFHVAADYELTLCCRPYEVTIPFGYPVFDGDLVGDFREKPTFHHMVNSGIYCMSPEVLSEIPNQTHFNMTDLIHRLCKSKRRVGVFPLREPFHEIGRVASYREAEDFYREHFETGMEKPSP